MSSLVNILEHAGLVLSGAAAYLGIQFWRRRKAARMEAFAAQSLLEQARREAEIILRDARLAASEEALKLHEQTEQALAARRAERLELERRLADRETLINSQLERIVEAEKNLSHEKQALRQRIEALANRERELVELEQQARQR
ncbi:MAG TPA: Rnase Y domain-containing protein, partial [Clostridia bacterium]|nr:Rnase Y domain-containing protein [Clostridia bacterium]